MLHGLRIKRPQPPKAGNTPSLPLLGVVGPTSQLAKPQSPKAGNWKFAFVGGCGAYFTARQTTTPKGWKLTKFAFVGGCGAYFTARQTTTPKGWKLTKFAFVGGCGDYLPARQTTAQQQLEIQEAWDSPVSYCQGLWADYGLERFTDYADWALFPD